MLRCRGKASALLRQARGTFRRDFSISIPGAGESSFYVNDLDSFADDVTICKNLLMN